MGSLTTAARELARYKLDLLDIEEVRWDYWGRVRAGYRILSIKKINCEQDFLNNTGQYQKLRE